MKKDLKSVIKNVAKFLEKDLTDDDIEKLSKHLTFQNMKNMTSLEITKGCTDDDPGKANLKFFRKGVVGDHKNDMSLEISKEFDKWIEEHVSETDFVTDTE